MKGFGLLLALASVTPLLICGPPAVQAGEKIHIDSQNASIDGVVIQNIDETPATPPAGLQAVPDPGSCGGRLEQAVINENSTACRPLRRIGSGVKRLLCFLLPC
jgi:hypothetical protein